MPPALRPTQWLFGDQLGPYFLDDADAEATGGSGPVLLVESRRVFARRTFHRQKAHLVLSAMRHRAAELGDRVTYARTGTYREALADVSGPLRVVHPTSRAAVRLVLAVARERAVERLPARGYVTSQEDFASWAAGRGRRRLLMEDFYRDARRRTGAGRWESPSRGGRRRTRSTRRCAPTSTAGNETATSGLSAATADATEAACLRHTLAEVRDHGWEHHIPRLMILGGYAAQRGWRPDELTDWFHRAFVDGYDWVMVPNVVGMSQHADGGVMATKPYLSGGAYLDRMTDHCGGCRFDPRTRVGEDACPFTAGYWWYLHRNRERLAGNQRMSRALGGLDRLRDLDALVAREDRRGSDPP